MKSIRKTLMVAGSVLAAAVMAVSLSSQTPQAAEALDKEEVRSIVREYLTEHPEVVIEAIESYQANQQEIEARRFKDTVSSKQQALFDESLPFIGNPDADIVIAEFFDFNCGYCKRAIDDIVKVIEKDPNVKVVFHEMPILSEASSDAARYAQAAHKQGKYFAYHQALMKFSGSKSRDNLESIAKDVGLDVEQLRKDANSTEVREEIENSLALSRELGIRGTPAFVVGDMLAPGYMTYQNMLEMIAEVRENKG